MKEFLNQAIIIPLKYPELFVERQFPWKFILLYGPSGNGKTLLAKAVTNEANNARFFSLCCSDLLSMWLGDSEKLLKNLFDLARTHKPSIVFIDEIESLSTKTDGESDSLRRLILELFTQMEGI